MFGRRKLKPVQIASLHGKVGPQPIALRNGQSTWDPRLDRVRAVDVRSLNYLVRDTFETTLAPRSFTWRLPLWLDQGREGACVGFGWAHELAAMPAMVEGITNIFAREKIYWPAQQIDPWPGGAYPGASPIYEGTSVLAGAQVVQRMGYIGEYRWALDLQDLILAVGYKGPAVIGVDWYEGMLDTDAAGYVHPTGQIVGGHCLIIHGVRIIKRADGSINHYKSYFTLHNSWGSSWGVNGRARITFAEMLKLWPGGDFCIPMNRVKVPA